ANATAKRSAKRRTLATNGGWSNVLLGNYKRTQKETSRNEPDAWLPSLPYPPTFARPSRRFRYFDKSSLFKLLTNITYLGKIRYKEEIHQGEHQAIVPEELWNNVNKKLKHNGKTGGIAVRNKFGALLKGLVRCVACNCAMTPKTGRRQEAKCDWSHSGLQPPVSSLECARVTQIMNLRLLAPGLQEQLLNFPRVERGQDSLCLRKIQSIALEPDWKQQREMWKDLSIL
ncbi:MAG: recombinase family protein, partial [Pirellula sp.]